MDISTFRWILIILGVVIIVGIFLLGNPEKKRNKRASRQRRKKSRKPAKAAVPARQEPTLDGTQEPAAADETPMQEDAQADLPMEPARPAAPVAAPDKIITLYLRGRDNHHISGLDLLDSALKSGMVFGPHDVFHRVLEGETQPLFSMANLTNPGTFDKDNWATLETRGVTMFMTLPGPLGALDAWDAMLATSRRLAELMHADLLGDTREVFSRQHEGEIREALRAYERDRQPAQ